MMPFPESDRTAGSLPAYESWKDHHPRQAALLEFVVAAGWRGATAKRLARVTFGEPEFPAREKARLSATYRDLRELERQGKVVRVSSSRPMEWVAAGARP
jgi:hypothetical protein